MGSGGAEGGAGDCGVVGFMRAGGRLHGPHQEDKPLTRRRVREQRRSGRVVEEQEEEAGVEGFLHSSHAFAKRPSRQ